MIKLTTYLKKSSIFRYTLLFLLLVIAQNTVSAQLAVPFTPRLDGGSLRVKGDVVFIGNTVVTGQGLPQPYNGSQNNNSTTAIYVNVESGGDPSIFSSSSADLAIANSCKEVLYAGLYWASVYPLEEATNGGQPFEGTPRFEDWNEIKFRLPTGGYIDLVADDNPDPLGEEDDIIFDGFAFNDLAGGDVQDSFKDSPIICYKNVTNLVRGLAEPNGEYAVANLRATRGRRNGGSSGGWTLVVIFESPELPSKFISLFDGYAGVGGSTDLDIPVSGFQTLPAPLPVNANISVGALEGDIGIRGDRFSFKATSNANFTDLFDAVNPVNNFFNSTISNNGVINLDRNPASTNTLGIDINNIIVPNPGNLIIPNGETSGDLNLRTSGDGYGAFVTSFSVDIIEPNIVLTKVIEDELGNNIGNQVLNLGQELTYVIGFQNIGNDDATNFIIRDILPINTVLDFPSGITLPPGVSIQSYDPATREVIFEIEDSFVEEFDPSSEIRIQVNVVTSCQDLEEACSDIIQNQAFATYTSESNPDFLITDDPSFSNNVGCLLTPQTTNFLAEIDDCTFEEELILCGATLDITAADGYDGYVWSTSPTGTPEIPGTRDMQTITVSSTGTFFSFNEAIAPCRSIVQQYNVQLFGGTTTNPVIPFADEVVICPNDGQELPNIYLCGIDDFVNIDTDISGALEIIWEVLDETSCPAVSDTDCANRDNSCGWNEVFRGQDFIANTAGQFRLTINYEGGCFVQFFFNVYQNTLAPEAVPTDIICTTPGSIIINNVPSDYEYSLDGTTYQPSNIIPINTPGFYTVFIRQVGVNTNPCIFEVRDIEIRERNFTVTPTIGQPLCNGDKGSIRIAINDVEPQYTFTLFQNGTEVNSVGPIASNNQLFDNLDPGTYTFLAETEDGCTFTSEEINIIEPSLLTVSAGVTTPLTCGPGIVTITPNGGTAPYTYIIDNDTSNPIGVPEFEVTSAGTYTIAVFDANGVCSANTSVEVSANDIPVFNVNPTNVLCNNETTGEIEFDVTNANGYAIMYSIDNGVTFSSNDTFSNLGFGDYETLIQYSLGTAICTTTAQTITITQPDEALTASGGVSQLAGCGPAGEGTIRVTNPQGGTPFPAPNFYEYSFDNQVTWVTTNEAQVDPGTYTIFIRDANGCIFEMQDIVLDVEPPAPTIEVGDTDFNCDGSGNATVTVTNNGGSNFSYQYFLDGVLNPDTVNPETFTDVPSGPHTISVGYTLETVSTFSNLLVETFGYGGNTTSPGINTTFYCFENQILPGSCNGNISINDGEYSVTSDIIAPFGTWLDPVDHTPATTPPTPDGRFLVVNIGADIPESAILYQQEINDVIPNQPIQVEFAALNLLRTGTNGFNPNLIVELKDPSGMVIDSYNTGDIPKTNDWIEYPLTPNSLDPGANTSLTFVLRSNVQQEDGNDVAIDDIRVFQLPESCITVVDFPFIIPTDNIFGAQVTGSNPVSCDGETDGDITIAVENFDTTTGFEYSIDNGVTWITQLTSPFTIEDLSAQNYDIQVRFEDDPDTCIIALMREVTIPDPILVSASNTDATCINGATITATSTGGTSGYTYQLIDMTTTPFTVTDFLGNGTLPDVDPGTYTIEATDTIGCNGETTITIDAPELPTATISPTSNLCYDPATGASLVVTASGGNAPYQYNINGGTFQSNNTFNNLTPDTYSIIVRDAFGCEFPLADQTIEPQLISIATITKGLDCSTSPDAIITGTITGGTAPYTYAVSENGGPFTSLGTTGTPFTFSAASAGTYQFEITDALGCMAESEINMVTAITTPTATTNATDPLCFNDSNGEVEIIASGGSGGYMYSFNGSAFTSTSTYNALDATSTTATTSVFNYQVQDDNGCLSPVLTVTLNNPTEVVATASIPPNTTCSATTEITVSGSGGNGPYTYSFNGSTSFNSDNTLTVTNTSTTQTITYSVRDNNGCIDTETIDIPPYNPVTGITFVNSNNITCNVTSTNVTLTAVDGIAPFTFEILSPASAISNTSGATSGIFTGLTPDTYVFEVTDANGCTASTSHTIDPAENIVIAASNTDQTCFGADDSSATFTITDVSAVGNFTFTLMPNLGSVTQSGNTVSYTNLPVGSYTFAVEDSTTGCTDTANITVDPTTEITFTTSTTNINCNNTSSTITFPTLSGGSGGYTFAFVTTGTAAPITADYGTSTVVDTSVLGTSIDVYVMDSNNCVVFDTITIVTDVLPTITATVDNQCTGSGNNFMITATATGLPTLSYSIDGSNFQTDNTFDVAAGTYTVTVRDRNGCLATDTVTIEPQLTLNAALDKNITCTLPAEAQITLTASGGDSSSYTYAVSNDAGATFTPIASNIFATLTPGSYLFMVTDANSCPVETTTPIEVVAAVDPDITVVQTNFINCNGQETAAISITPDTSLGQSPYVFEVINTTTGVNYDSQTSGLAAGDYTITVTDANGCTDTKNLPITEPDPIIPLVRAEPITCDTMTGISQGSVIIQSVTGGTAPYNYFVTSTNGYDESELNATGSTSVTFNTVDFGLYQVIIVDDNGCSVLRQDLLVASPPDDLLIDIEPTVDCALGGEAVVTVNTTLASPGPFLFGIFDGTLPLPPITDLSFWQPETTPGTRETTFTNLLADVTYTFVVFDTVTGCSYFETADIPIPTNSILEVDAPDSNNVTCLGSGDGNVSFTITNPGATSIDVEYQIFDSLSVTPVSAAVTANIIGGGTFPVIDFGPLTPGNYFVLITETSGPNAGCGITTDAFNISQSAIDFDLTASVTSNENCDDLGVITAIGSNGTAPYRYQILLDSDPAPTTATDPNWDTANTFDRAADDYIVYAIDDNGCIEDFDLPPFVRDAEPIIDAQTAPCFEGNPIDITITGTVSVGTATYSINGTSYSPNPNFSISTPGTYTLYIQDGNGCVATTPYIINDQLILRTNITKQLDCTVNPDAEITLTATGGDNTSYSYQVSTDGGATFTPIATNVYPASTAGTYIFTATDATGICMSTATEILDPIVPVIFTAPGTDVNCNGGNDGTITVNVTSGSGGPYMYQLDSGTPQSLNLFEGLTQNTYTVTVIDANECRYPTTVIINEPTPLNVSDSVPTNTTCDVASVITVTVGGGTPFTGGGYQYNFNGTGFSNSNTFTVNDNGTTQVVNYIVRDANGCTVPGTRNIAPLDSPTDLDFSATPITCIVTTSDVTLTVTGGVATLNYEIISPASAITNTSGAASGVFTGLTADDYIFQVTDANGCSYTELFTVDDVENITVSGQLISDVTCNPGSNGEVVFTVGGFASTYSYTINGGAPITGQTSSTINISSLTSASTQTIVVTDDATSCFDTASIDVSIPMPLTLVPNPFINANCDDDAQVSVTASGGTGNYSYSFVVSGQPAGTYTNLNTAMLDPNVSTTWDVYVQDANNCVISTPLTITIATDPEPTGITFSGSPCLSATNDYSFTVNVASGISPFEYSIGNGFQTSPDFTVSSTGVYTVTVRDANGCTSTAPYTIDQPVGLSLVPVNPSCTDDDGTITVNGIAGSGDYSYAISPNPATAVLTGNVFSGLPADNYTITITDNITSCTNNASTNLETAIPVTFGLAAEGVTCSGDTDGVITVNLLPGNDNPIYTYEIIAPIIVPAQTSNVFPGLAPGVYTIQVNSDRGCMETDTVEVITPNPINVPTPIVTQYSCDSGTNSLNLATITVNGVTGGSNIYINYEFIRNGTRVQLSSSNTYIESDLTGGSYTVNVFDDKSCIGTFTPIIINPYSDLDDININVDTAITCINPEDITVTVISSTASTPTNLEYTVEDIVGTTTGGVFSDTNTTGIFTGLGIGNYIVTVLNLDTDCSLETTYFVNDPDTFDIIIENQVDITCLTDGSSGSVNISFVDLVVNSTNPDQSGPFNYTITDSLGAPVTSGIATSAGPIPILNLDGGTYTVEATLTNNPFCDVSKNFTINQPPSILTLNLSESSNVTCLNNLGSITAVAGGGFGNYQYELSGDDTQAFSSDSVFENLRAGNYTVSVMDSAGCRFSQNITLSLPTPITADPLTATPLVCFGDNNSSITVSNVSGGQGENYTYTLNSDAPIPMFTNGPQTSNVFNNLAAGTYSVTINDGFNCVHTTNDIIITQPTRVTPNLIRETAQTCIVDATLTLSATGGVAPYEYSDDETFGSVIGSFTTDVTFSVPVGTYAYYVRDNSGCISLISNEILIVEIPDVEVTLLSDNITINCAGDNNASIMANATGGVGNYIYTLEDNLGNPVSATQPTPGFFTGLSAGNYVVTVMSGLDCSGSSSPITITEPDFALSAVPNPTNITCAGFENGSIEIIAQGGTGTYIYAISPRLNQFFEENLFENLDAGFYDVIVQDERGCFMLLEDIEITEPDPVLVSVVPGSILPEVCAGDLDGEFTILIEGGTLPYSVSLDDFNGPYTTGGTAQDEFDFENLAGGDHIVFVRDAEGCESEWNITFPESINLSPTVAVVYDCEQITLNNTVTVSVDDSITDLTQLDYSLNGGIFQASNTFTDVPVGLNYVITVRHTNGCIRTTAPFDIINYIPIVLTVTDTDINEITANASGGTGDFTFTFNGIDFGSNNVFDITQSGVIVVIATDTNGCFQRVEIEREFIEICIPNYFTPNNDGVLDVFTPGCIDDFPNLDFDIFDRYGRKIGTFRVGEAWDGLYNGAELPSGDYWYLIRTNDDVVDREFVGHFTLYR